MVEYKDYLEKGAPLSKRMEPAIQRGHDGSIESFLPGVGVENQSSPAVGFGTSIVKDEFLVNKGYKDEMIHDAVIPLAKYFNELVEAKKLPD